MGTFVSVGRGGSSRQRGGRSGGGCGGDHALHHELLGGEGRESGEEGEDAAASHVSQAAHHI